MVQVIHRPESEHSSYGGGHPRIEIHFIRRHVHGNGIAITVYGEVLTAAKEVIFARELQLNTVEELQLTPMTGSHYGFIPNKWIYNKGEFDNYASVDIFAPDNVYEMYPPGSRIGTAIAAPASLPGGYVNSTLVEGSIWLDFEALGE